MITDEAKLAKWERLLDRLPQAGDLQFWRDLNPHLPITDRPFELNPAPPQPSPEALELYREQMIEEGYTQTSPTLPPDMLQQMVAAVESVRKLDLPPVFAFVYDIFFQGLTCFDPAFRQLMGNGYRLVPNIWIYYVEPKEESKGLAPHRDAEYTGALTADGLPTVATIWIPITDATTLNGCMYVVPKHRDPEYDASVHDLSIMADYFGWEDVRALPAPAGSMIAWTQYLFHWGSRSSRHAAQPRISFAVYLQRGDIPDYEPETHPIPANLTFEERLSVICHSLRHYAYNQIQNWPRAEEMLAFIQRHSR